MTKKTKHVKHRYTPQLIALITVLAAGAIGSLAYYAGSHKTNNNAVFTQIPEGYVFEDQARNHVANFYDQYAKPGVTAEFQKKLLESYGSKNLAFYNAYYQHGFDPMVCSSVMPTKVAVAAVTPGRVVTVDISAEYPDHSTATLTATVVLNNEGLQIDSITCPGDKGGLPPETL